MKAIVILIIVALIGLVLYALFGTDLPADVVDPWTPPHE